MFFPTRALVEDTLGFITVTQAGAGESKLFASLAGLIKTAINPTIDTLLADLDEADFNTYARSAALTWSAVFDDIGGRISVEGDSQHYQMTDNLAPNTIYGGFIVDGGGTILLGVEIFAQPIPLNTTDDAFTWTPRVSLPIAGGWGYGLVG